MRTLVFRIEYDGEPFSGFQRQRDPGLQTVQGLLESILSQVLDEPVECVCAGRTDTGVHAIGQFAHVRTRSSRPLETVARALWMKAHGRLSVSGAWEAPAWFHARHSAARRIYQYHLLAEPRPRTMLAPRSWHVWRDLDVELMQREASSLLGRRDFRAFQAGGEMAHFFRTLHRFEVVAPQPPNGDARSHLRAAVDEARLICIELEADAFLPHMVRMLTGTLVDVGSGLRPPHTMARVLRSRDPRESSAAAPPHGLCLVRVEYPAAVRAALRSAPGFSDEFQISKL